jgi:small subunit ribosomal protein S9
MADEEQQEPQAPVEDAAPAAAETAPAQEPQAAAEEAPQAAPAAPEDAPVETPQAAAEEALVEQAEEQVEELVAAVEEQVEEALVEAVQEQVEEDEEDDEPAPREKPAVPGAHLEVDIVPEGVDPLSRGDSYEDSYAIDPYAIEDEAEEAQEDEDADEALAEPISTAAIDLASGARYRATGKRKSAIARVTLRPGTGSYVVNGRTLETHFPRLTLQRNIRQPLETVGYQDRMDVVARLHGGGISAQAGALRHGVSRALLEADPNLRGELKRRGFLTRDSRAKERKKAGLKKARKRPQFSKR